MCKCIAQQLSVETTKRKNERNAWDDDPFKTKKKQIYIICAT